MSEYLPGLIWLVVLAIAFAGGFFFDTWMRYVPQRELVNALKEDLAIMENTVQELEGGIDRLGEFEALNISQAEDLQNATTHLTILSARTAVADAALAIEQNRTADAKLVLDKIHDREHLPAQRIELSPILIERKSCIPSQ